MSRVGETVRVGESEAGFTLFELLAVLAIVALVVGVGVFTQSLTNRSAALKSAALETAAIFREARASAINRGSRQTVLIDVARHTIATGGGVRPFVLPADIAMTITAAAGVRRSNEGAGISFFPNGSSTGGALRYDWEKNSILVRVNWLTGRVSLDTL